MGDSNVKRVALLSGFSFAIIATFYLLREHWGHALGMLPYLLLLACPLLHMFHGHGAHPHSRADRDQNDARPAP
jgi:Protein of unknown function (DUF2933)